MLIDTQDPSYIIVLCEMSQSETEVLFEHTRRMRSRPDAKYRLLIEADGRDMRGKQEYELARKPSRSRSQSKEGG